MGYRTMMCFLLSSPIEPQVLEKLLLRIFMDARKAGLTHVNLVFYDIPLKKVFEEYRDAFTKVIDLGVRIFVENNYERLTKLFNDEKCEIIYIYRDDASSREILSKLRLLNKVAEIE